MESFITTLKCPMCGCVIKDNQKDSKEEFKEEYCGMCDTQFGYEEHIYMVEDPDHDIIDGVEPKAIEARAYRSYKLAEMQQYVLARKS